MNARSRLTALLVIAVIVFTIGVYLRLEAHALCTNAIHMPGTPGTELNATGTDEYHFDALVEIARILLCLAAAVFATVAAAWIFLPDFRMAGYMDMMKNWPSSPGDLSDDPRFPR